MKKNFFSFIIFLSTSILFLNNVSSFAEKITFKPKEIVNQKPKYGEVHLELEEETLIKESESDSRYMFKYIWDFVVDSKGNVYLLDDGKISKFDNQGKFIATIGKKGQGPGEFMAPQKLFLDNKDNLYVNDQGASLVKFDPKGAFIELIKLKFNIPSFPVESRNFYVDEQGNVFAFHRGFSERGIEKILVKANKDGVILKKIMVFPEKGLTVKGNISGGAVGGIIHPYTPNCYFCAVENNKLCFGENTNYRLYLYDFEGNLNMTFTLDEKPKPISSEEKKKLGGSKDIVLPSHRPFFKGMLSDEKGRIYVLRTKSVLDQNKMEDIDVFSKDGVYLYKIKLAYLPRVIRNGYIYIISKNEQREIKRLIIKNYDILKEN